MGYAVPAVVLTLAASLAGAWVNGARWEGKYTSLQLEHAAAESARKDRNMAAVLEGQASVIDAIQNAQYSAQKNEAAYAELTKTIVGLRGTVSGLRGEFSNLPGFIRSASAEALGTYAQTCTVVFERMAGEIASLGEAGAGVARQADRLAEDVERLGGFSEQ